MKRVWIAVLMVMLAVPATAFAQAPVAAWCGGSYGAQGTNYGECVLIERDAQVAGSGSGVKPQVVKVQTAPEYPSSMVTFENGRAYFTTTDATGKDIKRELNLPWAVQ